MRHNTVIIGILFNLSCPFLRDTHDDETNMLQVYRQILLMDQ